MERDLLPFGHILRYYEDGQPIILRQRPEVTCLRS